MSNILHQELDLRVRRKLRAVGGEKRCISVSGNQNRQNHFRDRGDALAILIVLGFDIAETLCPRLVGECSQARVGVVTRVTFRCVPVLMESFRSQKPLLYSVLRHLFLHELLMCLRLGPGNLRRKTTASLRTGIDVARLVVVARMPWLSSPRSSTSRARFEASTISHTSQCGAFGHGWREHIGSGPCLSACIEYHASVRGECFVFASEKR